MAKGRGIQYTDMIDNKHICVIGDYLNRRIFGGNGLGQTLKVGANKYRIVGVLEGQDLQTTTSTRAATTTLLLTCPIPRP